MSETKAVLFDKLGGVDTLYIGNIPIPQLNSGEVLLNVKAIGLNRAEVLYVAGLYVERPKSFPASIGYEGAGIIEKVADDVKDFKVGDRVAVLTNLPLSKYTTGKEHAVIPSKSLVHMKPNESFTEAASFWLGTLTAYFAFTDVAQVKSSDFVVITAASSSAGLAAINVAKGYGAKVIATSRTSAKKDLILSHGADFFIATGEEDIVARIKEITNGVGANVFYDPVAGKQVDQLVDAAAYKATIIIYGALSMEQTPFPILKIMAKHLNFKGYILGEFSMDPAKLKRAADYLNKAQYKSIVGKTFKGIESSLDAFKYLNERDLFGKVVVDFESKL